MALKYFSLEFYLRFITIHPSRPFAWFLTISSSHSKVDSPHSKLQNHLKLSGVDTIMSWVGKFPTFTAQVAVNTQAYERGCLREPDGCVSDIHRTHN